LLARFDQRRQGKPELPGINRHAVLALVGQGLEGLDSEHKLRRRSFCQPGHGLLAGQGIIGGVDLGISELPGIVFQHVAALQLQRVKSAAPIVV
jgi:hypothetical protein